MTEFPPPEAVERQPVFNLPAVILWTLAVLIAVFAAQSFLPVDWSRWIIITFAFVPARFTELGAEFPGGSIGGLWTFVSYAFLHADITHLAMNGIWLAAFGSPLARRFGAGRFLLLSLAGAIAGALTFLVLHIGAEVPVVGASAAVSAQMAAASRFIFSAGGPLAQFVPSNGPEAYRQPAVPLGELFGDSRFLTFTGVWFVINLVVGLVGIGNGLTIAWEAHVGGFLAGLLLFPLLDPVGRHQSRDMP